TGWEAGGSPESIATNSRQQRVRVVREKSTWKRAQSAGKNHGVEGLAAELRSQIISDCSLVWLGGRDSNPDTVVQSHVSYRWTTSQCQSRTVERRELAIIANPNWSEQVRRLTPERRSSGSIVSAGNRSRSSIRSIRGQYWVVLHP